MIIDRSIIREFSQLLVVSTFFVTIAVYLLRTMLMCTGLMRSFCSKAAKKAVKFGKHLKLKKKKHVRIQQSSADTNLALEPESQSASSEDVAETHDSASHSDIDQAGMSDNAASSPNVQNQESAVDTIANSHSNSSELNTNDSVVSEVAQNASTTSSVDSHNSMFYHTMVEFSQDSLMAENTSAVKLNTLATSSSSDSAVSEVAQNTSTTSSMDSHKSMFDRTMIEFNQDSLMGEHSAAVKLTFLGWVRGSHQMWGEIKAKDFPEANFRRVFVRWTADNWNTYTDTDAKITTSDFNLKLSSRSMMLAQTNKFRDYTFEVPVPEWSGMVEFAVAYQADGNWSWDNNSYSNYKYTIPKQQ